MVQSASADTAVRSQEPAVSTNSARVAETAGRCNFIERCPDARQAPKDLLFCELEHIVKSRKQRIGSAYGLEASGPNAGEGLIGLSLSGGGIRSATFGLGVIQALAEKNLLRYFDYLSTVSGGGYIGGALTWFLSGQSGGTFGVSGKTLPHSREASLSKYGLLSFLREHGNYLMPGKGITLFSFLTVILRGILLNAIVWIPIFSALMLLVVILSEAMWKAVGGLLGESTPWTFATWRAVDGAAPYWSATDDVIRGLQVPILVIAACFVLCCVVYSILTFFSGNGGGEGANARSLRYRARRLYERTMGNVLEVGLVFVVLATLPWVHHWMEDAAAHAGSASLLLGIVSGLWSFAKSGTGNQKRRVSLPLGVITSLGAALFLYGLGVVSYLLALRFLLVIMQPLDAVWWVLAVVGLVASILIAVMADLNFLSIHRYYRDRLMETFMPDIPVKDDNTFAWKSDRGYLSLMNNHVGPYHLICTNVVLVESENRKHRHRGGASFLLSPLFCGSSATGWVRTEKFMQNKLTLPTAVAISGAAVHPNTGAGGVGPTRNKILSLLMAFLNMRLGYWVPNPDPGESAGRPMRPNHFTAIRDEIFSRGYRENAKFLQLSDGGHFENLAVYELIRRRVQVIICCDAAMDDESRFFDLQSLIRRVKDDFGADISFGEGDSDLDALVPNQTDEYFPQEIRYAQRGFAFGRIDYADGHVGIFVLLKTTLPPNIDITLRGYRRRHESFPDQSTADQFFSERQFEAYRSLGHQIASALVESQCCPLPVSLGRAGRLEEAIQEAIGVMPQAPA